MCVVCDQGVMETQEHFSMECGGLRPLRDRHGVENGDRISDLLFEEKIEENNPKKYLTDIFKENRKEKRHDREYNKSAKISLMPLQRLWGGLYQFRKMRTCCVCVVLFSSGIVT